MTTHLSTSTYDPSITLDYVHTFAFGRTTAAGTDLSDSDWAQLTATLRNLIAQSHTIVASAYGEGMTSDQPDVLPEETYVVIAIGHAPTEILRRNVATMLHTYGLSSACFATDYRHEPAFASCANGYRPLARHTRRPTAATYAPTHGGYPTPA